MHLSCWRGAGDVGRDIDIVSIVGSRGEGRTRILTESDRSPALSEWFPLSYSSTGHLFFQGEVRTGNKRYA